MHIHIDHLVPLPLKDKILARPADIWNKTCTFLKGQHIKIKAPSGTGKTTFVHMLYKVRNDYQGNILWDDVNITGIKGNQLAHIRQQRISIIFQDMRLFDNLSARENIELKRVLTTPIYPAEIIDEMAAKLGIAGILHQQAGICSYGEQQRIAIIRALMQNFDWLIMDEPFSHLDKENTQKAAALILAECEKRKAGFIITDLDDDIHFDYSHHYNM